ncbi:lipase family protein [Paraburkholderia sp. J67]|uniref:lipase family protein n=1 Tax=Paraburkholderia sp. J67 TaxID=2805435 RepID=UPI002ABE88B7|nr:lipase family protein [Paraburkholderia sp. J67]
MKILALATRHARSKYLATLLVPIAMVLAGCTSVENHANHSTPVHADPRLPDGDGGLPAFYTWSNAIPAAPGQLLRSESLTPSQSLVNAGRNIRILYSSTNGVDNHTPVVVSGALYLPKGTPPKDGWPLMAWAHGTVGTADVCAPSFAGRSARDTAYLNYWLSQGYAIVATDYQGLGTAGLHPYGLTRPLAYDVLDSIRAVQRGDFSLSSRVLVFGQSQGARAGFATAVYAKHYAPELDIVGLIATGSPYATAKLKTKSTEHGLTSTSVDPTFAYVILRFGTAALLDASFSPGDYLNAKAMSVFDLSQRACLPDLEQKVVSEGVTASESFKRPWPKALVDEFTQQAAYPALDSSIPIFMGTGGKDVDVYTADQLKLDEDACMTGDRIEFHLYPALDHSGAVNGSLPDSTLFAKRAFLGEHIAGNCTRHP